MLGMMLYQSSSYNLYLQFKPIDIIGNQPTNQFSISMSFCLTPIICDIDENKDVTREFGFSFDNKSLLEYENLLEHVIVNKKRCATFITRSNLFNYSLNNYSWQKSAKKIRKEIIYA